MHLSCLYLPLAVLLHLLDSAKNKITLEPAESIDKENAVKMIDLVLHGACQQLFTFDFKPLAGDILSFHFDPRGALHLFTNVRQAETTLFFDLLALSSR